MKSNRLSMWLSILLWPLSLLKSASEKRLNVGGQAVIEGVMMRAPKSWAVAVRHPDGQIKEFVTPYIGIGDRYPILKTPFIRGAVVLFESLFIGLKALNYSADQAVIGEEKLAEDKSELKIKEPKSLLDLSLPENATAADEQLGETKVESLPEKSLQVKSLIENPIKTEPKNENSPKGLSTLALVGTMVFSLGLALVLFLLLPHLLTMVAGKYLNFTDTSPKFHLMDGLVKFAFFLTYVVAIGFIPDIRKVFAYHGAEHQAIYAYEKGAELKADKIKDFSPYHPRCGTAFIFLVLTVSIFIFAVVLPLLMPQGDGLAYRLIWGVGLKFILLFPLAGIAYEITRLAGKYSANPFWHLVSYPGLLLQRLTTRTPNDSQREVAIVSLKKAVSVSMETL